MVCPGVDARASVAVVVWGPDGVPSLDEAITRAGYACVDVVLGTDVFHSGGQYTAVPYLTTLAHLCTRWCCTGGYVLSSFRSEATTALVEAACATLGLARTVLHDTISPSATSASLKTEDVYLLEHL